MNSMRTKIIAFGALLLIAVAVIFFFLLQGEKDIMAGSPKIERPTSMPGPTAPVEPITDPRYKEPDTGNGVVGAEDPVKAVDPAYFTKLFLPYVDENNVPAGSGFAIESSEKLTVGAVFTAKAYPKGASVSDSRTVELGKGTVPSSGILKFNAALPTNLSLGSYTIEVSDGTKVFQTPFVIRPPMN
jgi:hypothetical protein